ncbi:N-acetyltransferase [Allorhizocola rhizosphaerae]|uniref:N-acetyltransferase n=1 Tax=Allorhizocola rhizosphaerae TaxID=1872709 RepID=UPI000E3C179A|nr:N-acetyltransferase [Allorhizocola rhizosphaerae]
MELRTSVLADRPDLWGDAFWDMEDSWPEFMKHDPIGNTYYAVAVELFADYILVFEDERGEIVAKAYTAPFKSVGDELFDDGWDGVIRRALRTKLVGDTPDTVSAIEIVIKPGLQGLGLSGKILAAMRKNVARLGFRELFAPVRPNGKADPTEPMSSYAFRVRDDGLPVDPWLRVHVRVGGVIEKVATRSMVIPGTLAEWREWTGLPFDQSGPVIVPKALTPVLCDVEHDRAVYIEPNVWVRHKTVA